MAGGKGTRLWSINNDMIPKPLTQIAGKPIIELGIERLKENGVDEIFISISHLGDKIKDYFGDGHNFGVIIHYIEEKTPLGSGGALYYMKPFIDDDFIVCSGDVIFDINIAKMIKYHQDNQSMITLFTHPNSHPFDSDLIICDETGLVTGFDSKNNVRDYYYQNNVNAGFFIVSPKALDYFDEPKMVSMEHDFINHFVVGEDKVYAYKSSEYIADVGTEKRFLSVEKDIKAGLVTARNSKNKQKAIFFDRDGTLNVYKGFISNASDIELLPDVSKALNLVNRSSYLAIVITNQPVIARGEATFSQVNEMFNKIETLLGKDGAYIDGYYYCPHHPDSGFEGEVKELKIDCDCRKPKIGLLQKAVNDFNLDLSKCVIIGDTNLDIKTGLNAKIPQILVTSTATEEKHLEPTYHASNIIDAVTYVLNKEARQEE